MKLSLSFLPHWLHLFTILSKGTFFIGSSERNGRGNIIKCSVLGFRHEEEYERDWGNENDDKDDVGVLPYPFLKNKIKGFD